MDKKNIRVCGTCRALNPANGHCDLFFRTKNIRDVSEMYGVPEYAPTEPCYKPLKYSDYVEALRIRTQERAKEFGGE